MTVLVRITTGERSFRPPNLKELARFVRQYESPYKLRSMSIVVGATRRYDSVTIDSVRLIL